MYTPARKGQGPAHEHLQENRRGRLSGAADSDKKNPAGCVISRVLSRLVGGSPARRGRPFIWTRRCRRALRRRVRRQKRPTRDDYSLNHATSLLGLAPGGVCHARPVTRPAVRSYRTISPLPCDPTSRAAGRYLFCGTVPVPVGPTDRAEQNGGRYPPPRFRGARTFLPPPQRRGAAFHASGRPHYTAAGEERGNSSADYSDWARQNLPAPGAAGR